MTDQQRPEDRGAYTAGPWKVFLVKDGPNKGQLLGVGQETGEGVADAYGGLWGSGGEKLANAHLIAAAPDLYEALSAMVADAERIGIEAGIADQADPEIVDQARAALAKARPTQPEVG